MDDISGKDPRNGTLEINKHTKQMAVEDVPLFIQRNCSGRAMTSLSLWATTSALKAFHIISYRLSLL